MWKEIVGKTLTRAQITALLTKGKTGKISGFKSKSGKTFDAKLQLTKEGVTFLFADKKRDTYGWK